MNNPQDTPRRETPDELDAWLAARPVRPSLGLADAVFARIAAEAEASDPEIEALLASRPLVAPVGLADRVMVEVTALRRRRQVVFRFVVPVAFAACLTFAALPSLFSGRSSASERIAATLAADAELNALAALPVGKGASLQTEDLAALAELGAGFHDDTEDHAYEI